MRTNRFFIVLGLVAAALISFVLPLIPIKLTRITAFAAEVAAVFLAAYAVHAMKLA